MKQEVWKDIKDCDIYEVSSNGNLRHKHDKSASRKPMKPKRGSESPISVKVMAQTAYSTQRDIALQNSRK